jgi:hypothetical protein
LVLSKYAEVLLLSIKAAITTIRPALIVECLLHDSDPELGPEALARFFDPVWREHPAGTQGAVLLGALAHTARAHGGRELAISLLGE